MKSARSTGRRRIPVASGWSMTVSLALLVLISGCADRTEPDKLLGPGPEDLPAESISFLTLDPSDRYNHEIEHAAIDRVVEEIETRSRYRIAITYLAVDSYEAYEAAVHAILEGEHSFDIVYLRDGDLARSLSAHGIFVALDETLGRFAPDYFARIRSEIWDVNRFRGSIVGLPLEIRAVRGYYLTTHRLEMPHPVSGISIVEAAEKAVRQTNRTTAGLVTPPTHPVQSPLDYPDNGATFVEFVLAVEDGIRPVPGIETLLWYHDDESDTIESLVDRIPDRLIDVVMSVGPKIASGIIPLLRGRQEGPVGWARAGEIPMPRYLALLTTGSWETSLFPVGVAGYDNAFELFRDIPPSNEFPEGIDWGIPSPIRSISGRAEDFLFVASQSADRLPVILSCVEALHSEELYELCTYGIEGLHWERLDDDRYTPVEEPIWTLHASTASSGDPGAGQQSIELDRPVYPQRHGHNPLALLAYEPARALTDSRLQASARSVLKELRSAIDSSPIDPVSGFLPDLSSFGRQIESLLAQHRIAYLEMLSGERDILETITRIDEISGSDIREIRLELDRQYREYRRTGEE